MARVSFKSDDTLSKFIYIVQQYGINKYISLPERSALGSKQSSLFSALVQLQLHYKIDTRCPLHFCMQKSAYKRAEVSIQWNTRSEYKDEAAWSKVYLDNWEDAVAQVAAAQALILDRAGSGVASDVIEVNVYGPECVDLTLIDLPGIVRTVGKAETHRLIEDIKQLIDSYLSNPHCTILAIQPAITDFFDYDAYEVDPVRCLVLYERT